MKIRKFSIKDTKEVALLVMHTYKKYNGAESFQKEAASRYINFYNPKKTKEADLLAKFKRTPIFFVAIENHRIIGMIRGRPDNISNLFVDGREHKKGIGRLLVNKFENDAKKQGSKEIKIRASLYAAPFYQKMGYKKTTGIRNFRGLKIYPMKKYLA